MYAEERRIASIAVQCASLLTKSVMRSITHISKKDATPVTVADFAVQALLISTLSQAFPTDNFLGEESASALREDAHLCQKVWELVSSAPHSQSVGKCSAALVQPSSPEQMMELIDRGGLGTGGRHGRTWIMDPIDGTATFIDGGQYAVAVALIEDGKEVLGVIGAPNLALELDDLESAPVDTDAYGFMVSAVRGDRGVTIQPILPDNLPPGQFMPSRPPLPRNKETPGNSSDLNFVDSHIGEKYHLEKGAQFAHWLGCARFPGTDVWSTQIRLVIIALGKRNSKNAQIRIPPPKAPGGEEDPENFIWDYAGAHLILLEAGGYTSDLNGKDLDFGAGRRLSDNWGLIATSNQELHREVLGKVQEFVE